MTRRPGAYAIVRREGRVLLVWDQEDGEWYFPGGGIEAGESPEVALAREVAEETGFRLTACSPLVTVDHPEPDRVKECAYFLAAVDDHDPGAAEHDLEWVTPVEAAIRMAHHGANRTALTVATPSVVTATVADLHDPVFPAPGTDHRQAVADAGCFDVVEADDGPPFDRVPSELRIVAANLERGRHLDAWVELFTAAEPDVLLLSEADGGMARSGNRYVARELADRLGMAFAFAVEFVELSLGGEEERVALPPDATNEFGVHGGAVLSRVGLDRPAAVRFEFDGEWYEADSDEPRVGGRCAVVGAVGDLVVVAPHLESHGEPAGRSRQLADLLDLVEPYAAGRPVVVGGDLNTHTLHLRRPEPPDRPFDPERFLDPVPREPLFAEAAARGYRWEEANVAGPTLRRGGANLDWFLVRGVEVGDPVTIPAVDATGHPISDHDVLAVTVR